MLCNPCFNSPSCGELFYLFGGIDWVLGFSVSITRGNCTRLVTHLERIVSDLEGVVMDEPFS